MSLTSFVKFKIVIYRTSSNLTLPTSGENKAEGVPQTLHLKKV